MSDVAEIEERLRRTYRAVAEHTAVTRELDAEASLPALERPSFRPPGGGLRWAAVVLALAGVAAAVGVGVATRDDGRDPVAAGPDVGTWERLPDPPVSDWGQGQVWTGAELIRFGGTGTPHSTGAAAYDPAAGTWRRLADLPDEVAGASLGVWTGHEVVAFAVQTPGVAATYDPATDEWQLVSDPAIPYLGAGSYAFWTGDEVLLAGFPTSEAASTDVRPEPGRAALFDPATGEWRALPDAPQPIFPNGAAVWTGDQAVFVTAAPGDLGEGPPYEPVAPERMATLTLDPATGTWRQPEGPPLSYREDPVLVWTGAEVVMAGGISPAEADRDGAPLGDAVALDPATGEWRAYPAPPVSVSGDLVVSESSAAVTDDQVVAMQTADPDGRPLVLDPAAQAWRFGAPPPEGTPTTGRWIAISIGTDVVAFDEEGARAFTFTPPAPGR
jgi:hypothetical protein